MIDNPQTGNNEANSEPYGKFYEGKVVCDMNYIQSCWKNVHLFDLERNFRSVLSVEGNLVVSVPSLRLFV